MNWRLRVLEGLALAIAVALAARVVWSPRTEVAVVAFTFAIDTRQQVRDIEVGGGRHSKLTA